MTGWKEYLDEVNLPTFHDWKQVPITMQEHFPGNYSVIVNTSTGELELKFNSPQDETMFLLKYS